jgi:hypothetical protein
MALPPDWNGADAVYDEIVKCGQRFLRHRLCNIDVKLEVPYARVIKILVNNSELRAEMDDGTGTICNRGGFEPACFLVRI